MNHPSVLITGASGQDGQLLAQRLVERAQRIVGVIPPAGPDTIAQIDTPGVELVEADLSDPRACRAVVAAARPDVVFHLAAVSSVARSWEEPELTSELNGLSAVSLLAECLDQADRDGREIRLVNASSAEIFGNAEVFPQNEQTALAPNSPYGASKAFAHTMVQLFRERGLWATNAILYNHESTLRPPAFVTRKITMGAAAIAMGTAQTLQLGNLDARRDWGWAPDYVDCLIRMAWHESPEDFVVATGVSHSVRDFVAAAFAAAGISDWERYVQVQSDLLRPTDAVDLVGDAAKARRLLDWQPTMRFAQIVETMVEADLRMIADQRNQ